MHLRVDALPMYPYGHDDTHYECTYNRYALVLQEVHLAGDKMHYWHDGEHARHCDDADDWDRYVDDGHPPDMGMHQELASV